jgi:hypothetical protein
MPTALFFARDPGPANHVVAAYGLRLGAAAGLADGALQFASALGACADAPIVLAHGAAVGVFARAGIACAAPPAGFAAPGARDARVAACAAFLRAHNVGAVVTGTSDVDEDTDRVLWSAARSCGLASHAFLDHPANMHARFAEADGSLILPDHLYAPDARYAAALAEAGIDAAGLRVTGPLYDRALQATRAQALAARPRLRRLWHAEPEDRVVLFASECGREMAEQGRQAAYDELAVLLGLTDELATATQTVLVVRPHPRDRVGKYDAWRAAAPVALRPCVSADGSPAEAILAADLVAGMDSTMLREARALGRAFRSLTGADLSL